MTLISMTTARGAARLNENIMGRAWLVAKAYLPGGVILSMVQCQ